MKVNSLNQNSNCMTLSKRPKSGDKDKYQTIMNNKIQNKYKYSSYFQSPNKAEDLLFIKKKFQKIKKSSKEKMKNKKSDNINSTNLNYSNNNISSSYISFMSPMNKNSIVTKKNYGLTKFLKNQFILNSIDNNSSFINNKEKEKEKKNEKGMSYNTNTNSNILINNSNIGAKKNSPDTSNKKFNNNGNNRVLSNNNLNEEIMKDISTNKIRKKKNNKMMMGNKENKNEKSKIQSKDKEKEKEKSKKKLNGFNNIMKDNNHLYHQQNKLYSMKGMFNNNINKKNIKNISEQNLLSNTVFEYNKSQHTNGINFFENYVKAVAMNKANKISSNKSISININKSNNYGNISNKKKYNNITNNISNTNREVNQYGIGNSSKKAFMFSNMHSPKSNNNIAKTSKTSPKNSLININAALKKMNKKLKGHIKNKSISIVTNPESSLLYKNNVNGPITNNYKYNKYKINFTNTHANETSTNNISNNFYSKNNQYKYSLNLSKKLKIFNILNNSKKGNSSAYNSIYFKKKTQTNNNSKENHLMNKNYKITTTKNSNNINNNTNGNIIAKTTNNSKNKNIYINKNYLSKHNKHVSSLDNSTNFYYNNPGTRMGGTSNEREINTYNHNHHHNQHQYQKTEDIIVNNYNININNQINNANTFFSGNIITPAGKKKNKNNMNKNSYLNNTTSQASNTNLINNSKPTYKQSLRKKKILSQSLKDILISNNKSIKNYTTNNSPIKFDSLLNTVKNNDNKMNEHKIEYKISNLKKYTYKKWFSNREKEKNAPPKKKIFESISSRRKEMKMDSKNRLVIENCNINNDNRTQRKNIVNRKKIFGKDEKNKNLLKNITINDNNNYINNELNENNTVESQYYPTLSSRSSVSYDANYYMKESHKLSYYISKYYSKNKKYPNTSLNFYKYGRLIGQGAFGKVNLGLNILTGRIVAIKSFNKNNAELTGDNMKKIKYETDLMKKLNHPNITKILEMFEDEKYFLIIMEYINGGNLFSFVKKRRKLSEKTAKFLFRQIILGIKYIHEQGIVHRDIKLENLLIDLNNNVKICDFGIGRKITSKGQLLYDQCGTLMYMAPEILLSTKEKGYEGFPVDIWSSGISLYIMLSGSLPFNYKNKKRDNMNEEKDVENEEDNEESMGEKNDEDNFELQYSIVYKEPKHIENISDDARDLLKGLLNKDPRKRLTCDQILNHRWLSDFKDKNKSGNKFHLFTKAEMIMLSKTFIDYRKANSDDLKENFTLSNLEMDENKNKNNSNENITNKSSILAPYNSIVTDFDSCSQGLTLKSEKEDLFNDFNNSKIKLENDGIIFSKKIKEYNRLYELNNNGEVDNGVLINSRTQSSLNSYSRSIKANNNDLLDLNISNESLVIYNNNDMVDDKKRKNKKTSHNNNSMKSLDEEKEQKIKSNNILNEMSLIGYDKKYVLECVKKNELCHASAVYYLMMNYENL